MEVIVQAYIHRIKVIPLKQLPIISVAVLNMVPIAEGIQLAFLQITGRNHLYARNTVVSIHMIMRNDSRADQANAYFFNMIIPS